MKGKILEELINEIRSRGIVAVAKASGIPKRTVESWVYGKAIPSLDKAERLLDSIGLELLIFDKMD